MIEQILPAQVVAFSTDGSRAPYEMWPEEEAHISKAVKKRILEYSAARDCARRALQVLGISPCAIPHGEHRQPIWPPEVVGSITHCEGYYAAAVARQSEVLALGIDVELHRPLSTGLLNHICLPEEIDWLQHAPESVNWPVLFFSAKESLYKTLFPLTSTWIGFHDVSVRFDWGRQIFEATLGKGIASLPGHSSYHGKYLILNQFVFTAIVLTRDGNLLDYGIRNMATN